MTNEGRIGKGGHVKVTLTVVDPATRVEADLLLDADPATRVGDLADTLARAVRAGGASAGPGATATVVSLASRRPGFGVGAEDDDGLGSMLPAVGTRIFVAGDPVDPDLELGASPIREGTLVSLDDPTGCVRPEPDGLVEVRVVSGPGAGVVHRLSVGESELGSDPRAAVVVADHGVPAVAAHIAVDVEGICHLTPGPAGEADTILQLDQEPVTESVVWPAGAQLRVGTVLLELATPEAPDAALEPSSDGVGLDYNRPPRLLPPLRQTRFKLPMPPTETERRPLPIIAALAPMVMAVVMVLAFNRIYFLVFGLLTPAVMIGNYFYDKRRNRTSYRQQLADYRERRKSIEADAKEALVAERIARRHDAADPGTALLIAVGPRARLWERRTEDPDHLVLRVGTADQPSEVVLEDPEEPEHRREVTWEAMDVPVTIPLKERGVIGIAGRDGLPEQLAAWMVAQIAVLQSPRDVEVYVLTEPAAAEYWRWLRWLPHARPGFGQDTVTLVGADTESLARRVAELGQLITARQRATRENRGASLNEPDVVVVLDGARRLRSLPGVVQVLKEGPAVGVYAVCLDTDERLLPEECAAVVAPGLTGLRVSQQRVNVVDGVRADVVPWPWFERVARALAPVRDVSDSGDDGAIPTACRLLDVIDLEPPAPEVIEARWRLGGRTTEAVVGASLDGPFALDLVRDGPHGLIAGTTGAGKSELLQTIVASLAVANRPDAMTFVLVDYKGGAAFKDCVHLPHTVGMVTDLDTHLVERALESLGAELHRREHMLAAAGAKDIEDYVDLMRSRPELDVMPRLLIVIDEFASMVRELPDFVTGLVNIAQRGRSLGIHLILATQRPSGVVSPEIRANTNLRIALRVTDAAESTDVLDAPDAAQIAKSTPGRAYVRLGASSLVPFQAGRVGGRRPGTVDTARPDPFVANIGWGDLGRPAPARPKVSGPSTDVEVTDLSVLVESIRQANGALAIPPQHSPWLPALPDVLTLDELEQQFPVVSAEPGSHRLPPVPYALEDIPAEQARRPAVIDLASFGHLYIAGAPRSGRSQLLRTMAAGLGKHTSAADVHLFALDCGNGALLPLTKLPHCGAVVQRNQTERAQRLLGRLSAEVTRRQDVLGDGGFADITEQRAAVAPEDRLPHLVLMLDRWEGFIGSLGELDHGALTDQVMTLLREGASVGVHLIVAGDRSLLSSRMATLVEHKLVFRLADRGDFTLAGLSPRKMPETIEPGRAFWSESATETQIAMITADPVGQAQAAALEAIAEQARERDRDLPRARRPFRVDVLPSRLSFDDAWGMREDEADRALWGLVGVGGDELLPVGPDLAAGAPTFVVAGPPKSGRSTVLLAMTESFLRQGTDVVVAAPRQSPLRDLDGRAGVRAVLTSDDLSEDELRPLLDDGDEPVVFIVDDGEMLRDIPAKDWLRGYIRSLADRRRGIVLGGDAADLCGGFTGWQVDIKKNRSGALLSPQNVTDSDLVGAKLPRSAVGGQVTPGRAMVHLGTGELVTVQVPMPDGGS
jgi:S-DNA-T family DNA segregation ATPase FtsK/SpoIIIE